MGRSDRVSKLPQTMRKPRHRPNAAYKVLRDSGMRPAIARHFLVRLREFGFVVVEEKSITTTAQINESIKTIIALMRAGNRRRK